MVSDELDSNSSRRIVNFTRNCMYQLFLCESKTEENRKRKELEESSYRRALAEARQQKDKNEYIKHKQVIFQLNSF